VKSRGKLSLGVHKLPDELDMEVARLKLETMGIRIDQLTEEQRKYITGWELGT
jgi:adenosylhomocysteinase (EC 3.3.1.1)